MCSSASFPDQVPGNENDPESSNGYYMTKICIAYKLGLLLVEQASPSLSTACDCFRNACGHMSRSVLGKIREASLL